MKKRVLLSGALIASLSLASELPLSEDTNWVDKEQTIQDFISDFHKFFAAYHPVKEEVVQAEQNFADNIRAKIYQLSSRDNHVDLADALWAYEGAKEEICPAACEREYQELNPQPWNVARFYRGITDFEKTQYSTGEEIIDSVNSLCVSSTGEVLALLNGRHGASYRRGGQCIRSIDMSTENHEKTDLHRYGQGDYGHIAASPDRETFAFSAPYYDAVHYRQNSTIYTQSPKDKRPKQLAQLVGAVKHISYTADGLYLIAKIKDSSSKSKKVFNHLLDAQTGENITDKNIVNYYFPAHLFPAHFVHKKSAQDKDAVYTHSYDNTMIAVAKPNANGTYRTVVFDHTNGQTIDLPIATNRKVKALALSRDKRKLAIISFDAKKRKLSRPNQHDSQKSKLVCESPDTIHIVYLDNSQKTKTIDHRGYYIEDLNFSPDGNHLVYRFNEVIPTYYQVAVLPVEEREEEEEEKSSF